MSVDVAVAEAPEAAALQAEQWFRQGIAPVLVCRPTWRDGQRVVDYLRARPDPVPCRLSPPQESAALFSAAVRALPRIVHVYVEAPAPPPPRPRKVRDARWRR